MTGPSPAHRTGTGHLPEARATSWGCTCGAAEVRTYGHSVTGEWALRLMRSLAACHQLYPHLTAKGAS